MKIKISSVQLRKKVAREAAVLLYASQEKEYKQAKLKAAETLGTRILPSNIEVAEELDRIAEELEGPSRLKHLIQMREEALKIMDCLRHYHPRLIGSVWRGTIHRNSDIDIIVFSSEVNLVVNKLKEENFNITGVERFSIIDRGEKEDSLHIHVVFSSGGKAEIIVRNPEKMKRKEKCEIYGGIKKGLSLTELQRVLKEDPLQRFVPEIK